MLAVSLPMRRRWPILAVVLAVVCGAIPLAGSDSNARDQKIVQIQQLIQDHNLADAKRLLEEAAAQYPADAGIDNLLGILQAQEGNAAAAESSFRRAIRLSPKFTAAYLNLGRLYQESFQADPQTVNKALALYTSVLAYEPRNEEANYQSATLLLREAKYEESLGHVSRLPSDVQGRAQALSIACAGYAAVGDRRAANRAAERLLAQPDFSEADVQPMLPGLFTGKRDDLAISILEGLQNRQKLSPPLLYALGSAYARSHRLVEARATLEKSATPDNLSVPLLLELAKVAHEQKDYQGALGYLAHARDLDPKNASLHYYFGLVCLDLNLLAEAGNSFDKAVKLEPENPTYNYTMGSVAQFRHDPAEAVPFFQKYLELKPGDARGKLALGTAYFRAKDYDAAVPWLTQAVQESETATAAHYYLGSIAVQQRRFDQALSHLQFALQTDPDYVNARAELGHYYLIKKDYGEAEKQIRRALALDPDHLGANLNLLTLYIRTGDQRREEQAKHFDELQKLRDERAQEFMRIVEVRPFGTL